jgi:hypothetical protein
LKKLIIFLVIALASFSAIAQSATIAPSSGNWLLIDTTYSVGSSVANQTSAVISYQNSTASKITAVQFRVFYDKIAFKSPVVALIPSATSLSLQYTTDTTAGHITISLVYTGNSTSYSLPTGAMFNITFNHAPAAVFQYLTNIDSIKFTGPATFTHLASTQSGNDTTVTLFSYGGAFNRPMLKFRGHLANVTGTDCKNITVSIEKQPKSGGAWTILESQATNTAGLFSFNTIVDTTWWNTRIQIKGDTMSLGATVSIADAQKVNRFVLGLDNPVAFDYHASDVNGDNLISISDAYVIYGRLAGRFSAWTNSVTDVKFFTPAEYNTITGTPATNYSSTIPGNTNIIYNIIGGGVDSVEYYVLGKGDANATGFKMAKITPIKITNPFNKDVIIDESVEYYAADLNTIEINLPSLSVDEGNLVNIPVKVFTKGQKVGALQIALSYDTTLLEFKGIVSEEKVGSWMSFLNDNNGIIEWGGYDVSATKNLLNDFDQAITLQFLAKEPKDNWSSSPIYVTRKFAGDEFAKDVNINPTNSVVNVMKMAKQGLLSDDYIASILVYPNPTTGEVVVEFAVPKEGQTSLAFYDLGGTKQKTVVDSYMPKGIYKYRASLTGLTAGIYTAILKTGSDIAYNKTILN